MTRLLRRVLAFLRHERAEEELAREVASHLAMLEVEYVRRGMPPDAARDAARRAMGGIEQAKALHRDARSFPWLEDARHDVRYALRMVARSRGTSLVSVLVIALGIGSTATLFSLTYGVLLKPLPWSDSDRLVRLEERRGGHLGRVPTTISNTTYHAWRNRPATLEQIGGWTRSERVTLAAGAGAPERVQVSGVTPSLFRVLRATPAAGRLFADGPPPPLGSATELLLGFGLWQRRFGGRVDVFGQTIAIDDRLFTIVGVMPASFAFPDRDTQAWRAMYIPDVRPGADMIRAMIFNALGRLRAGVTPEQASAEGTARGRAAPTLGQAALALFGSTGAIQITAIPARDAMTADVRPAITLLMAAVTLLFLTAMASLVVIQSSRATRRRREMAVRGAIGASAGRMARQWLVESLLLGVAGGLAGLLLATGLHRGLPALLPPDFPRVDDVEVNLPVALCSAILALCAVLVCGLVPALQGRRVNLLETLGTDSAATGTPARVSRLRTTMMASQVAIACLLLVSTALMLRSFAALVSADRGFEVRDLLTAYISVPAAPFVQRGSALEAVVAQLAALPGVTAVGFGDSLPFASIGGLRGLTLEAPHAPGGKVQAQVLLRTVSPDYFTAMGLRMLAGRALTEADTPASRPVVVVNQTFASRYLGGNAIGVSLPMSVGSRRDWEIVGVVDDIRQGGLTGVTPGPFGGMDEPPQAELFFPYTQWDANVSEVAFVLRTTGDSVALAPAVRAILHDADPAFAVDSIMTMEDRLMNSLARPRTYAILFAGFALFALTIAAVGLFGALSYLASQRTREIGVRTALGAQRSDIVRLVSREAIATTITGLALGLAAAFIAGRPFSALLYGVSPNDPVSFGVVTLLVLVVAVGACAAPALRATRISPLTALRTE